MPSEISLRILSDPYADHFLSDPQLPCLPLQLQRAASGSQWSRPWTWSLGRNELGKPRAKEGWSLRSQWPWMLWLLKRRGGCGVAGQERHRFPGSFSFPCPPHLSLENRKKCFILRYQWSGAASCESCTPFSAPRVFSSQAAPP